jgi:hypothetical protein
MSGIAEPYSNSVINFWKNYQIILQMAAQFYITTSSERSFQFLQSLSISVFLKIAILMGSCNWLFEFVFP